MLRRSPPFQGMPALPGGFVELGETCAAAVVREVREETGLWTRVAEIVGVYSDPDRDPRGHVVSVAFALRVVGGRLREGSDASGIVLLDRGRLPRLAFDHNRIVRDFLTASKRSSTGRRSP